MCTILMLKTLKNQNFIGMFHLIVLLSSFIACDAFKGQNYAVLRGSSIRINCIPQNTQVEGESDIGSSYTWTDENGKEVIDARFTKLASGELEIANANITDSGIYTCKFRPPTTSKNDEMEKSFQHKLLVFEIPGHTFSSSAFFDLSRYSAEGTVSVLNQLMKYRVCGEVFCIPREVKSAKCALLQNGKQVCELELSYKSFEPLPDDQCDEDCVNTIMFERLKKAEQILKISLMAELEKSKALLMPDLRSFHTRHIITCTAGFRLVKTHRKRCFPCFPGTYSKEGSLTCHPCAIGFYQEHFGQHECVKCEEGKATKSVGAKSEEECILANPGIFTNIKEGLKSIFTG